MNVKGIVYLLVVYFFKVLLLIVYGLCWDMLFNRSLSWYESRYVFKIINVFVILFGLKYKVVWILLGNCINWWWYDYFIINFVIRVKN